MGKLRIVILNLHLAFTRKQQVKNLKLGTKSRSFAPAAALRSKAQGLKDDEKQTAPSF